MKKMPEEVVVLGGRRGREEGRQAAGKSRLFATHHPAVSNTSIHAGLRRGPYEQQTRAGPTRRGIWEAGAVTVFLPGFCAFAQLLVHDSLQDWPKRGNYIV